jgi:hypothetical protein
MEGVDDVDLDNLRALLGDYQVAQAVAVAVDLRIPELLADGPKAIDELTQATGAHQQSLDRLLRALASAGVFARSSAGHYAAGPLAPVLQSVALDPEAIRALPDGLPHERESWQHLRYSVMTGESAFRQLHGMSSWAFHERHQDRGDVLHATMSRGTQTWAHAVLAAYSFAGLKCVVDVGGGRGGLIAAILRAYPSLHGILFDQPSVVRGAVPLLATARVADRCTIVAGDFFTHVPAGGDLYLTKSIIHNWEDNDARRILGNCRAVMRLDSKLVLIEPVIAPGNLTEREKYFMDLHMLVIHGSRERTSEEFAMLLSSAGFRLTQIIPTEMMGSVIEAVPV